MAPTVKLPFSGYVRVSTVGGRAGPSFISPDVQEQTIRRLALAHGLELSGITQELDVSGGKPVEERQLGQLVRDVESGASAGILVWKLSRFSRDLLDGVTVAHRVTAAGGRLLAEDFDSSQPMSKAILGLLLGFAEEERDARRAGWRAAQESAVARGVQPTKTPRGYLRTQEGTLVPDPATADLVRQAFQARAQGASLQACADIVGGSKSGVRSLLQSSTYLGHVRMGDLLNATAHEPLVSERTWHLAQSSAEPGVRDGSLANMGVLAGLVRCSGCGFVCSVIGRGTGKSHAASYSCRGRSAGNVCTSRASAAVARVDDYVWPLLQERAGSVDLEAALGELFEAQVAWAAADKELQAFLAGASIVALGADLYAAEVSRRRESLRAATEAYRQALASQEALTDSDGLQGRRELARRLLEGVTVSKAERGRHDPIAGRLELRWR